MQEHWRARGELWFTDRKSQFGRVGKVGEGCGVLGLRAACRWSCERPICISSSELLTVMRADCLKSGLFSFTSRC